MSSNPFSVGDSGPRALTCRLASLTLVAALFAHPLARTHPATGRKALYVNRLMTHHIEGLPEAESERLLALMFETIERPEFIYEHRWRVGDLLLWDNRCALHARRDFNPEENRWMRRVTIQGDRPR